MRRPQSVSTLSVATLGIALLCGACGETADDSGDDDDDDATELEGTWASTCADEGTGEPKTYAVVSMTFTGSTEKVSYTSYSDATCATVVFNLRMTGTVTLGEAVATPAGAKTIDEDPTAVFLTPNTAQMLAYFNGETEGTQPICGGGFAMGVEKQLTNALCKDSADYKTIEDTVYGIYKLDGNKLYQSVGGGDGSATDGTTAAKRQMTLETTPLIKK